MKADYTLGHVMERARGIAWEVLGAVLLFAFNAACIAAVILASC